MEESKLTPEQKKAKAEMLNRASALQQLQHVEGFVYLKAYYENKLKSFVSDMFNQEEKEIGAFEAERREIMGLKRMFGEIEWALSELEKERKNAKSTT